MKNSLRLFEVPLQYFLIARCEASGATDLINTCKCVLRVECFGNRWG